MMLAAPRSRLDLSDLLPKLTGEHAPALEQSALQRLLYRAMKANEVEALSCLLAVTAKGSDCEVRDEEWLAESAEELLRATFHKDGAECALSLLAALEQRRRAKEAQAPKPEVGQKRERPSHLQRILEAQKFCEPGPKADGLVKLAREALAQQPEPAKRVARAILLQTHRLCKTDLDEGFETDRWKELSRALNCRTEGLEWPAIESDMPGKNGGWDLAEGADTMSVQWINEVDDRKPPKIVYLRRCIDIDVRPDVLRKPARPCQAHSRDIVTGEAASCRCSLISHIFKGSKPSNFVECNWACVRDSTCSASCSRRSQQLGKCHRFQVFKHPAKGWCLRTLTFIASGEFVMEYVAERVTSDEGMKRSRLDPDVETYIMEVSKGSSASRCSAQFDALYVRNVAAYAAFACSDKYANMKREVARY